MSNLIYYEKLEDYEEQVKKAKLCDEKDKEIERLNNIIKEVREYINEDKNCIPKHIKDYFNNLLDKEIEI